MEPTAIGDLLKQATSFPRQTFPGLNMKGTSRSELPTGFGVPIRYQQWILSDYPSSVVDRVEKWAISDLWSLYLTGAAGTRKSSLAAAILRAYPGESYFATPEMTVRRIREFCDWWVERAKTIGLLIMDDLGSYRATPHVHDMLLSILACRYDNFRKTIVTSNASLTGIESWLDPRLADRLREGLVLLRGRESRRTTGNEEPTHAR